MQDCAPISMKKMYIINASKLMYKTVRFFQAVIKSDIFHRIMLFTPSEMDEFYELVPKECMPNEYGGKAGTLEELSRKTKDLVERHEELFDRLDLLKVDESKRPSQKKKKKSIRKLELD